MSLNHLNSTMTPLTLTTSPVSEASERSIQAAGFIARPINCGKRSVLFTESLLKSASSSSYMSSRGRRTRKCPRRNFPPGETWALTRPQFPVNTAHSMSSPVAPVDNDSDDEGTSAIKSEKDMAESAAGRGQEREDSGVAHEEDMCSEEDGDVSQLEAGVDSSDRDGRLSHSASCVGSRSESKPYSSMTHKCEVRNQCQHQSDVLFVWVFFAAT